MRSVFYLALSAIATLASAAQNPFNIPTNGYVFTAGESTTLSWDPTTSGTVTLKLQWGSILTASTGSTIVSNLANSGTYTWSVPSDIVARPDYTIEIISDSNEDEVNYLTRFTVVGATAIATTSTASSTSSSSTHTTLTTSKTSTKSTTATSTSATPTPTSSTSSSSSSSSSSSTSTTASATSETSSTSTPTSVPNTNSGVVNRVSGGLMALVMGAIALI